MTTRHTETRAQTSPPMKEFSRFRCAKVGTITGMAIERRQSLLEGIPLSGSKRQELSMPVYLWRNIASLTRLSEF